MSEWSPDQKLTLIQMSAKKPEGTPARANANEQVPFDPGASGYKPPPRPTPINTNVAREFHANPLFATAHGYGPQGSSVASTFGTGFTPVSSAYPRTIWTPITPGEAVQSATIPEKLSWETYASQFQEGFTPGHAGAYSPLPAPGIGMPQHRPAQAGAGLGLNLNTIAPVQDGNVKKSPATPGIGTQGTGQYRYVQQDIPDPQTSPLVQDAAAASFNTYPLEQQPFGSARDRANQPRSAWRQVAFTPSTGNEPGVNATSSAQPVGQAAQDGSVVTNPYEDTDKFDEPVDFVNDPGALSVWSELSEHVAVQDPTLANKEPPITFQQSHPLDWKTKELAHSPIQSSFLGALQTLSQLNPCFYQTQYGTRVICIKAESTAQVVRAVASGTWVTQDRVGARIMRLWDARAPPGQVPDPKKNVVFLLFSINSHKSYCGLAKMKGPWKQGGVPMNWPFGHRDPSKVYGTIPVEFVYVKNVTYERFKDVDHPNNQQPVYNMWNGMHFPEGTGPEVMKKYIKTPHFTNVLCWDPTGEYDPRQIPQGFQLDPIVFPPTNGALTRRGGHQNLRGRALGRGGLPINPSYRPQPEPEVESQNQGYAIQHDEMPQNDKDVPGPLTLDGHAGPTLAPGTKVTCIVDVHGNYVPISESLDTPGGNTRVDQTRDTARPLGRNLREQPQAPSPNMRGGFNNARGGFQGGYAARGGLAGLHGTRSFNEAYPMHGQRAPGYVGSPGAQQQPPTGLGNHAAPRGLHRAKTSYDLGQNFAEQYQPANVPDFARFTRAAPVANFTPCGHGGPSPVANMPSRFPATGGMKTPVGRGIVPPVDNTPSHGPINRAASATPRYEGGIMVGNALSTFATPTDAYNAAQTVAKSSNHVNVGAGAHYTINYTVNNYPTPVDAPGPVPALAPATADEDTSVYENDSLFGKFLDEEEKYRKKRENKKAPHSLHPLDQLPEGDPRRADAALSEYKDWSPEEREEALYAYRMSLRYNNAEARRRYRTTRFLSADDDDSVRTTSQDDIDRDIAVPDWGSSTTHEHDMVPPSMSESGIEYDSMSKGAPEDIRQAKKYANQRKRWAAWGGNGDWPDFVERDVNKLVNTPAASGANGGRGMDPAIDRVWEGLMQTESDAAEDEAEEVREKARRAIGGGVWLK